MSNISFTTKLTNLINEHSLEQYTDTPDFILAKYMLDCLKAYTNAVQQRDVRRIPGLEYDKMPAET